MVSPADRIAGAVGVLVSEELGRADGRRIPLYDAIIAIAEKPLIQVVLVHERWNLSHAALTLGINRNTLRKKMLDYGIKATSTGSGQA